MTLRDSYLVSNRVSTAMMMFDADDEVMSRSGGLYVWLRDRRKER